MIELTKKEAVAIADFIDFNIFENIRNDTEIDNIVWLETMMDVYKKCKAGEQE